MERKFEASAGVTWSFGSTASVGPERLHHLRATYLDTPMLDLVRAGWSLRRREGGGDAGWHLKIPQAEGRGRDEFQAPLAPELPDDMRELVTATFSTVPLVPVARVNTERREYEILIGDQPCALFAADAVSAESWSFAAPSQPWQEYEIELLPGADPHVLDTLSAALLRSGVRVAAYSSKAARALGLPRDAAPAVTRASSAGEVVMAYAAQQVGMLQATQPGLRTDAPDAVHKARVAVRRLRSVLRTYRDVVGHEWADALSSELRWWGEVLGDPRDAEVQAEQFAVVLNELGGAVDASVTRRILQDLSVRHSSALHRLTRSVSSERAVALRVALADFLSSPGARGALWQEPAEATLAGAMEDAVARVARAWERAEQVPEQLTRWHAVRKAAKVARYGYEALGPVGGTHSATRAESFEAVTEELGTLQDAHVASALIDDWEEAGGAMPVWSLLRAIQSDRSQAALVRGREAVSAALAFPSSASDLREGSVGHADHGGYRKFR